MQKDSKAAAQDKQPRRSMVNSMDAKAGKLTLNPKLIQSLDWPEMHMDFYVKDKPSLIKLKPGKKSRQN
jgi:Uncharacterized conserved protein